MKKKCTVRYVLRSFTIGSANGVVTILIHTLPYFAKKRSVLAVCYCMYTMCTNENLINTVHNIGFYKFITYVGFVRCLLGWRIW